MVRIIMRTTSYRRVRWLSSARSGRCGGRCWWSRAAAGCNGPLGPRAQPFGIPGERLRPSPARPIKDDAAAETRAMVDPDLLSRHLDFVLDDATIPELPNHYRGKVGDNHDLPDGRRLLTAT